MGLFPGFEDSVGVCRSFIFALSVHADVQKVLNSNHTPELLKAISQNERIVDNCRLRSCSYLSVNMFPSGFRLRKFPVSSSLSFRSTSASSNL